MKIYRVQTAPFTDHITDDFHQMTKLPYPFAVDEDGMVQRQEFWDGKVFKVVGFQRDLAKHQIDLWWQDAIKDLPKAVGMYLVTSDNKGNWGVHHTAVDEFEVIGEKS
jgi:hypothetical protein